MRLFVAVDLDPGVSSAAAMLIDELRRRSATLAPHARITWIPSDRMHLTVRFIGNVDDRLAAAIETGLVAPLVPGPFDLTLGRVGAFPRSGKPQVLWAAVQSGMASLQMVEREVTQRLATQGIPPETRPYNPHLTLARVRDAAALRTRPLFAGLENASLGTTHVEAITLYESRLSPRGPTYRAIQRIPLAVR